MNNLFDITTESIEGPSANNENVYDYYHKSNREDITIIRKLLEKWFEAYPDSEKKELKNRFKKNWDAAFYELFLYSLFRKLQYQVIIHPKVKDSNKRPDFLISKNNHKVYVEAKVCYDQSEQERAFERMKNQFYDQLNTLKVRGYYLRIASLNFISNKQPKVKELKAKIEKEVEGLDPKVIAAQMERYGFDGCPRITYENDDLSIVIQPLPVIESKRNVIIERPVSMFPFETFWGGGEKALRESILKKSKRYGKLDIPYLICINALGKRTSGHRDIENVIWGSLQYTYATDPKNRKRKMTEDSHGVFFNGGKNRLEHVSAVMVTKIFGSNIPIADYWLYQNPFAKYPLGSKQLKLGYHYVNSEKEITKEEGLSFDKIFDIPKNWLNSKNPPK